MCIISTAQHARPNVMGHMDPFLPQFNKSSNLANVYSAKLLGLLNGEYGRGAVRSGSDWGAVDWFLLVETLPKVPQMCFDKTFLMGAIFCAVHGTSAERIILLRKIG